MLTTKGQGIIEAVLCLPLLALFIKGLGVLIHRALLFHVTQYHLHEALICQQSVSKSICIIEARQRLAPLLFNSISLEVSINGNPKTPRAVAKIGLSPVMTVEKILALR